MQSSDEKRRLGALRAARRRLRNPERERARVYASLVRARAFTAAHKTACLYCGEARKPCLDFHHINPTDKDQTVSEATARGWSNARLLREIKKCLVVCANCHRWLHATERL